MSKSAWITLGLSCTFTSSLIYLVHRQQRVEKQAMRAGIVAEDEKRKLKVEKDKKEEESIILEEETRKRLERNRQDFELQQKLTRELSKDHQH